MGCDGRAGLNEFCFVDMHEYVQALNDEDIFLEIRFITKEFFFKCNLILFYFKIDHFDGCWACS